MLTRRNQSVIVSGDSGAGKTEANKLMLEYVRRPTEYSEYSSTISYAMLCCNALIPIMSIV